jgi:hypothetical protein
VLKNHFFGVPDPDNLPRETKIKPGTTRNSPQLTTTPGKYRRLVLSTTKWSVLIS